MRYGLLCIILVRCNLNSKKPEECECGGGSEPSLYSNTVIDINVLQLGKVSQDTKWLAENLLIKLSSSN